MLAGWPATYAHLRVCSDPTRRNVDVATATVDNCCRCDKCVRTMTTLDLLGDYQKSHPQWAQAIDLLPSGELQPQLSSWRKVKIMLGDGFTQMYRVNVSSGQVAAILAQMESLSRDISE